VVAKTLTALEILERFRATIHEHILYYQCPTRVSSYSACLAPGLLVRLNHLAPAQTEFRNQTVAEWPASAQAPVQQRKRRRAEALEEAEAEPERPARAVKRARTARLSWDDLLARAPLAYATVTRAALAKATKADAEYTQSIEQGHAPPPPLPPPVDADQATAAACSVAWEADLAAAAACYIAWAAPRDGEQAARPPFNADLAAAAACYAAWASPRNDERWVARVPILEAALAAVAGAGGEHRVARSYIVHAALGAVKGACDEHWVARSFVLAFALDAIERASEGAADAAALPPSSI